MTKKELMTKKLSAISLGCDKNKVDLEKMLGKVREYGIEVVSEVEEADIVIVNTCSFILPAEEEAIGNIIEMESLKRKGVIEKLIVSGCFPERHPNELSENFPLVDRFLRLRENDEIIGIIEELYGIEKSKQKPSNKRLLTSPNSYAYLKIADGCNNVCSFCTIPRIRGRYLSQPIEDLVAEAKMLADMGVKELILVAQDTSRYGEDLYGKNALIELCEKLSKIKDIKYIRMHYLYPEKVDRTLLDYIMKNEKMCKYIDIPLQHIDDDILKSMRRRVGEEETKALVKLIKEEYPEIKIRSTFIVGYAGENQSKFKKLCNFIREAEFDYAGFFPYSKEANTIAYYMKNQVKNFIKNYRYKKITLLQNHIYTKKAKEMINQEVSVLVDAFDENTGEFISHTPFQSPNVDFGVRFVEDKPVRVGDEVKVKIYDFDGRDYKGEML